MGILDTSEKRRNTLADLSRGLAAIAGGGSRQPAAAEAPASLSDRWPWALGAVVVLLLVVLLAVGARR